MNSLDRVTQAGIARNTINGLQLSLDKLQSLQEKLSTGKEINRPSDNPSGAVVALHYRSDIRRADQYSRNAKNGLDWLGQADSTLTGMMDQVQRARNLALQGSNASMSVDERQAMAAEIDTIREGLISQSNTSYLGRPIFAGNYSNPSGTTVAYDANGVYQGDNGAVMRNGRPEHAGAGERDRPAGVRHRFDQPVSGAVTDLRPTCAARTRPPSPTSPRSTWPTSTAR